MDNATCTRNLVGYILMDLRTAQIGSKVRLFQLFQVFPVYVKRVHIFTQGIMFMNIYTG